MENQIERKNSKQSKSPEKLASEAGTKRETAEKNFLVVGLGASAGGIKALKFFFRGVSKESGMAYVVILHLSPDYESKLAEVLQTTSRIPVRQVKERLVPVEPNCVYVMPAEQKPLDQRRTSGCFLDQKDLVPDRTFWCFPLISTEPQATPKS